MNKLVFIIGMMIVAAGCNQKEIISRKEGVSLPTVTNLALQEADSNRINLTWLIPGDIPESIEQPLSVFIEVKEKVNSARMVSVFNTTLPGAPLSFLYQVPDSSKTYHITVKLNGTTKARDVNYSSNIFSLGQTVIYH